MITEFDAGENETRCIASIHAIGDTHVIAASRDIHVSREGTAIDTFPVANFNVGI